jgi:hypothetical protein
VARYHLHVGGLADDGGARAQAGAAQMLDHAADAGAAHFLVK